MRPNLLQGLNKTISTTKSIRKLAHSIWSTIQSNVYFETHLKPQHQKKKTLTKPKIAY